MLLYVIRLGMSIVFLGALKQRMLECCVVLLILVIIVK